jgi:hypothetical protein
MAWAGFSSIEMALSVWRTSLTARRVRALGQLGVQLGFVAMQQEADVGKALGGQRHGGHDHGRAVIPAHGVDRNDYGVEARGAIGSCSGAPPVQG